MDNLLQHENNNPEEFASYLKHKLIALKVSESSEILEKLEQFLREVLSPEQVDRFLYRYGLKELPENTSANDPGLQERLDGLKKSGLVRISVIGQIMGGVSVSHISKTHKQCLEILFKPAQRMAIKAILEGLDNSNLINLSELTQRSVTFLNKIKEANTPLANIDFFDLVYRFWKEDFRDSHIALYNLQTLSLNREQLNLNETQNVTLDNVLNYVSQSYDNFLKEIEDSEYFKVTPDKRFLKKNIVYTQNKTFDINLVYTYAKGIDKSFFLRLEEILISKDTTNTIAEMINFVRINKRAPDKRNRKGVEKTELEVNLQKRWSEVVESKPLEKKYLEFLIRKH